MRLPEWNEPDNENNKSEKDDDISNDNEDNNGEINETEKHDRASICNDRVVVEVTSCTFQTQNKLEAYSTKCVENNKQAKVLIKFQDNTQLSLSTMLKDTPMVITRAPGNANYSPEFSAKS